MTNGTGDPYGKANRFGVQEVEGEGITLYSLSNCK